MSNDRESIKPSTVLPWFISLILVFALILVVVKRRGGQVGVFETIVRENEIVSTMRINLLRAAEAEKSAVMAVTDEQSQRFADQARLATANVDKARKQLAPLIEQDDSARETALIEEFDRCWAKFQTLDQLLPGLAVQNTNLHATNLALTKGARAVRDLERNLTRLIGPGTAQGRDVRMVRLAYQAVVAGLKIHDLYAPHIDAETDEQMDIIETEIEANEKILSDSMNELAGSIKGGGGDALQDATADCAELEEVTREIIDLSRENTSIKSLKLSLGKKRPITAQCDEILRVFQEFIRSRGTKATG
ncbi:MAG: hypothetical protein P4L43_07335 [Syntrophobacteraceae bacterium]|nr:hypothetical protein [Syntrophobacteraceae bacterium]